MIAFDHVAIAIRRIADAEPLLRDLLGGKPGEHGGGAGFTFKQYALPGGVVELLEPKGDDSFLLRFLRDRGEGLHHITFKVVDLRSWAARLRAAGYHVVGENYDNPEWQELFIHPKSGHGVLIQFAETRPPVPSASEYNWNVTGSMLPGADLIEIGLKDLSGGIESAPALLVSIGAPRLRRLGIAVPSPFPSPERRLYALLQQTNGDAAHTRYNALIRRLVSYERAVECAR